MKAVFLVLAVALGVGCHPSPERPRRPSEGAVAGLARDRDSGDPVALAEIQLTAAGKPPRKTTSNDRGMYHIDRVPPGTYAVRAVFAGQPIEIRNVVVTPGQASYVDVVFTLGRPEPLSGDYNDRASQIEHYRPRDLSPAVSIIEGTVSDAGSRERIAGAVVTAVGTGGTNQTVTDEHGRYRFDAVIPGEYAVSAYYSIGGRAQIEVRRSDISVAGAEAVSVPLWIELGR